MFPVPSSGLTLEPVSGRPSTEQRILDLSSDIVTALSLSFPTPQNLALAGDSARLLQFYRGSMADIHHAFDVALRKQGLIVKLGGLKKRLGEFDSSFFRFCGSIFERRLTPVSLVLGFRQGLELLQLGESVWSRTCWRGSFLFHRLILRFFPSSVTDFASFPQTLFGCFDYRFFDKAASFRR